MKIALCFSGLIRNFARLKPDLEENFFSVLRELGTLDIFVHTWSVVQEKLSASANVDCRSQIDQKITEKEVSDLFETENVVVENFDDLKQKFLFNNFTNAPIQNAGGHIADGVLFSIPMTYKIWACNNLKREKEIKDGFLYDLVIRFRSNLKFKYKFSLIKDYDEQINTPTGPPGGLFTDTFAYSTSKFMDLYSAIYEHLPQILSNEIPYTYKPEAIFGWYFERMINVPVKKNIDFSMLEMVRD